MNGSFKLKNVNDGEEHMLARESLLIGRDDGCDVVVKKGYPSRKHARLQARDGRWVIEDLGSTNGTYVNDRRIHNPTPVKTGDIIRFGSESYYLLSGDGGDETIVARKLGSAAVDARGSFVVSEDDSDGDMTSIQESFPLPPGWSDYTAEAATPEHSKTSVNRLLKESFARAPRIPNAALIFFMGARDPLVCGVSLQDKDSWSIGRKADCDFSIDDPSVSGHHADLCYRHGQWKLIDRNSTNGVRVQGSLKPEVALEDGTTVMLGQVEMVFRRGK